MDVAALFQGVKEYGFGAVMAVANIVLLYKIVMWTLAAHKDFMASVQKERETWVETINKIQGAIENHDKKAEERGRFVREEHRQMIETLGRINGYKHEG